MNRVKRTEPEEWTGFRFGRAGLECSGTGITVVGDLRIARPDGPNPGNDYLNAGQHPDKRVAREEGMITLRESGLSKIKQG